ncbi:allophanate hydrolase subunit 2 family protein, partial [Yersinia pestis PY-45]
MHKRPAANHGFL